MRRRSFLGGMMAGLALLAAAPRIYGSRFARGRGRFIFVFAEGGWDPLCFSTPKFGSSTIEMGPGSVATTIGGLHLVDHADRAPVRTFFQNHHAQTLIVNGLSTRSVSHEVCAEVAMTGTSSGATTDFPSLIANPKSALALPSLVLSGPSFPGELESIVSRAGENGQLASLASGSYFQSAIDKPSKRALDAPVGARVDAMVRDRAMRTGRDELDAALSRAAKLKTIGNTINLAAAGVGEQIDAAVEALSKGLSRCVSIGTDFIFDTHVDITGQDAVLSDLFTELDRLMGLLASTSSPDGGKLSDDTHVVIVSEMGRTPRLNDEAGRDHWPFTTAMIVGPGVTGDRQVGGFDDGYVGVGIDPPSGELAPGEPGLSTASFGATLLALADIDPKLVPFSTPLTGVLK